MPFVTLRTGRLVLRPPEPSDADAIFEGYATDPTVTRYLLFTPHRSIEDTRAFLDMVREQGANDALYYWAVIRRTDDRLLGTVRLGLDVPAGELGFALERAAWGQGYGTEMIGAVLAYARELDGLLTVRATVHPDNVASARVLEKNGMIRVGLLPRALVFPNLGREPRDVYLYVTRFAGDDHPSREGS